MCRVHRSEHLLAYHLTVTRTEQENEHGFCENTGSHPVAQRPEISILYKTLYRRSYIQGPNTTNTAPKTTSPPLKLELGDTECNPQCSGSACLRQVLIPIPDGPGFSDCQGSRGWPFCLDATPRELLSSRPDCPTALSQASPCSNPVSGTGIEK